MSLSPSIPSGHVLGLLVDVFEYEPNQLHRLFGWPVGAIRKAVAAARSSPVVRIHGALIKQDLVRELARRHSREPAALTFAYNECLRGARGALEARELPLQELEALCVERLVYLILVESYFWIKGASSRGAGKAKKTKVAPIEGR